MTQAYNNLKPGAMPVAFTKAITSAATDTLIWRVPWGNPVNKVFELRKIIFNTNSLSGGALSIWDQDLSSATPTKNGSAGASSHYDTITGIHKWKPSSSNVFNQ